MDSVVTDVGVEKTDGFVDGGIPLFGEADEDVLGIHEEAIGFSLGRLLMMVVMSKGTLEMRERLPPRRISIY